MSESFMTIPQILQNSVRPHFRRRPTLKLLPSPAWERCQSPPWCAPVRQHAGSPWRCLVYAFSIFSWSPGLLYSSSGIKLLPSPGSVANIFPDVRHTCVSTLAIPGGALCTHSEFSISAASPGVPVCFTLSLRGPARIPTALPSYATPLHSSG